jgi:hypothetical protein
MPQTVGNRVDFSAVVSGTIARAEGSFPIVNDVTSETDGTPDNYSLQLNSNYFAGTSLCAGAQDPAACYGWQQFIYVPGLAFIQYWLVHYLNACPSGWIDYAGDCWKSSVAAVSVPAEPITNLANLAVSGTTGSSDAVTVTVGQSIYTASQSTVFNLNQFWTVAEFNVFGNGDLTSAIFNSGALIVVQVLTDSVVPTQSPPFCDVGGFTAETNNLNLVSGSCWAFGGTTPGIQFTERACQPFACSDLGAQCGTIGDGCGGTLDCGTCASGDSCSLNMCCPAGTSWSTVTQSCSADPLVCGKGYGDCGGYCCKCGPRNPC